jgi:hypothetical protein
MCVKLIVIFIKYHYIKNMSMEKNCTYTWNFDEATNLTRRKYHIDMFVYLELYIYILYLIAYRLSYLAFFGYEM